MRMRSAFLIAATLFAAGITPELYGQAVGASRNNSQNSGTYTVTGKVVFPDGKSAVGAKVEVTCDFTNVTTFTDPDGTYRATGVPAGNCSVVARVPGYDPVTEYRTINNDMPQGQAFYVPIFLKGRSNVAEISDAGVPRQASDKYNLAVERIEKNDPDGALPLLDQAIALYPKFSAAWYRRGLIFLNKNDSAKAIESFVKAIENKPDYLEAKYGFGMAQLQKKDYAVAEAVFRDILKQRSDMAEAHLNLGISLFYLKKPDESETELKAAAASKGGEKLALAHLYLGQIYAQKKRNSEAAVELQKYINLVPKAPNAERIKTAIADLKKQS